MESKIKLIEHLIRHNDFLNNIFKGTIMRRRSRRANYFHDIKEKMNCIPYKQLKESTKDRHTWLFLRQGVAFKT